MQTRVKLFLVDLEKQLPKLLSEDEEMVALLVANLFVDHGIAPNEVLRALERAGLPNDPRQLAGFRDKRADLMAALELL